jgi:hypothetical protein
MNLKEYLANKPDAREKELTFPALDITVRIRRLTVGERKRLYGAYKIGTDQADAAGLTVELIAISLIPAMSIEEVEQLPAFISDMLMTEINEFNGWTKKGAAELADQFRATA